MARRARPRRRSGRARDSARDPRGRRFRGRRVEPRSRQSGRDVRLRPGARRLATEPCSYGRGRRDAAPSRMRSRLRLPRPAFRSQPSSPSRRWSEGGDTVWLDEETLLVGIGYRTNPAAVGALGDAFHGVDVIAFDLPHWNGRGEVMHLMSFISPLDRDLALVYPRIAPVRLLDLLAERGIEVVEVPDEEFETQGPNVLALGPRHALAARRQSRDPSPDGACRRRRRRLPRRGDLAQGRRRPHLSHAPAAPDLGPHEGPRGASSADSRTPRG